MPSEMYYEHTVVAVLGRMYGRAGDAAAHPAGAEDSAADGSTRPGCSSQDEWAHTAEAAVPCPAHRLGSWTSGVLLCARSARSVRRHEASAFPALETTAREELADAAAGKGGGGG
jgi:23S rRNA-/tRNA-specific pseudouridylate synthase